MVDTNANTNRKHETKNAIMRDHYLFISYEHRTQDTQDRTLKLILKMMKSPRENQKKGNLVAFSFRFHCELVSE